MSTASKLWMPGPQDRIFQHLLQPKAGPEGGRYQKLPIMFLLGLVCWTKYPKFMYTALISGCQGLGTAFSNTFVSLKLAQKVVSKSTHNFYQRASMLTKIPKIHIYSLKTLDARASGLHFPTPYWAWSLPWRWYQKIPMMFFHWPSTLSKIPKIHVYSFKTLDARASRLQIWTPSWALGLPRGCYPKFNPLRLLLMYLRRLGTNFITLALLV